MPTLPKAQRPPWVPQPAPKPAYHAHAERSPEYNTARWQRARKAQLAREPCCRACAQQGRTAPATVVDHIEPVRLGGAFYSEANHQSLCRPCHAKKSQSERQKNKLPTP